MITEFDTGTSETFNAVWTLDEYQCWNYRTEYEGREVHAFIQQRPAYCDRGHWSFNVMGIGSIDGADSFPRYFMSLDRAMIEAIVWLNWRLWKFREGQYPLTVSREDGGVIKVLKVFS
jgi:hypothetical protein